MGAGPIHTPGALCLILSASGLWILSIRDGEDGVVQMMSPQDELVIRAEAVMRQIWELCSMNLTADGLND